MCTPSSLTPEQEAEQARIIHEGTSRDAYLFALNIPGAAIQALQEVVLERSDGWNIYLFARDIPDANIQALQEVIVTRGNNDDIYRFACDVPAADILVCARRIMAVDPQGKNVHLTSLRKSHPQVLTPEVLADLGLGVTL